MNIIRAVRKQKRTDRVSEPPALTYKDVNVCYITIKGIMFHGIIAKANSGSEYSA